MAGGSQPGSGRGAELSLSLPPDSGQVERLLIAPTLGWVGWWFSRCTCTN